MCIPYLSTTIPVPPLWCLHPPSASVGTPQKWGHHKTPPSNTPEISPACPPIQYHSPSFQGDSHCRTQSVRVGAFQGPPRLRCPWVGGSPLCWGPRAVGTVPLPSAGPGTARAGRCSHPAPAKNTKPRTRPALGRQGSQDPRCVSQPLRGASHWGGTARGAEDPTQTGSPGTDSVSHVPLSPLCLGLAGCCRRGAAVPAPIPI